MILLPFPIEYTDSPDLKQALDAYAPKPIGNHFFSPKTGRIALGLPSQEDDWEIAICCGETT